MVSNDEASPAPSGSETPSRSWIRDGLILLLLAVTTVIGIGDPDVRIADMYADDNPIVYAQYSSDPDRYEGDILDTYAQMATRGSMQNWVTVALHRYLGMNPDRPTLVFMFLQRFLLGVMLAVLMVRAGVSRGIGIWLIVLFALTARIWRWNLGNFDGPGSDMMPMLPYAAYVAAPGLLACVCAAINERPRWAALFALLTGLVHPSLGLFTCGFLVLNVMLRDWQCVRRIVAGAILPVGVAILIVVPGLTIQAHGADRLSGEVMFDALRLNVH